MYEQRKHHLQVHSTPKPRPNSLLSAFLRRTGYRSIWNLRLYYCEQEATKWCNWSVSQNINSSSILLIRPPGQKIHSLTPAGILRPENFACAPHPNFIACSSAVIILPPEAAAHFQMLQILDWYVTHSPRL